MKKYILYAFEHYGIFIATKVIEKDNATLITGTFEKREKPKEFTFILHSKDKAI